MTSVLIAVTGVDYWTLADGTKHPCGYWPEELAAPHKVFTEAGLDITIATPGGIVPTADQAGYTPEMNGGSAAAGQKIADYIGSIADQLAAPAVLEDIDPADFDFVFVPGGHGPMEDLAVSEPFGHIVRRFTDAGKPVGAVCHGPAALFPAKADDGSWLFSGRRLTAFSNVEEGQVGYAARAAWLLEDRLKSEGGIYSAADQPWGELVVVDGNLYTGQNPASSEPLARRLVADTTS
ncbi:type 1 glutamine amidotransferase domain-containing protein [Rhodococcus opacus]|uniref:type 1 glutamine amidotransferase domain-containing protein n=1 Tax=Rhodococcus opacus TaxID=37919 RepID=UPI0007CD4BB3|nr:type 1 glutamine amidotransferase domain-containing protein [Rhodococcus opacus]MDX5969949.1 type 1 glutamine amidotransferase domain-containing protein [Rhodococcus opacus]NKY76727.1 type 1 glutamine amidotransferase domain-containing protein [Rhodococcus opacus]CAG7632069.1 Protein/nucleic acid deglycase HchA [Rhodococcus opacus]